MNTTLTATASMEPTLTNVSEVKPFDLAAEMSKIKNAGNSNSTTSNDIVSDALNTFIDSNQSDSFSQNFPLLVNDAGEPLP